MELFLLVESGDDERLIKNCIVPRLESKYDRVSIWQWAEEPTANTDRFLRGILATGDEYLFLADLEGDGTMPDEDRIAELCDRFANLDPDRVVIVRTRIEGWYVAGLRTESQRELRVDRGRIPTTTEYFTKEDLVRAQPERVRARNAFLKDITRKFSIAEAKKRNDSFRRFADRVDL